MSESNQVLVVSSEWAIDNNEQSPHARLDYEFFENFPSEHTRIAYRTDLKQFFQFILSEFGALESVANLIRPHVIAYRNFLQTTGGRRRKPCCPKTVIRKLAAVSSYCDFLVEKGLLAGNPTDSVMRPADQVITQTNDLSDEQIREVIQSVDTSKPAGLMHKAVLSLMFATGLRKSELIGLKLGDYTEQDGFRVVQFMGKRGKVNRVPLHPTASYHIDRYILGMKERGKLASSDEWLFQASRDNSGLGQVGNKLAPTSIDFIVKKYCSKIGVTTHITPHSARASVIGSLLEQGCDLYRVSQLVNHSNVKTTQGYDKRGRKISDSPVFRLKFF